MDRGGAAVRSGEPPQREGGGAAAAAAAAAMAALQQCELIQNMIEISISSLRGLRTKCAASNDLTQQEIRTLEVKLMKYICKQLQCKQKVPETERPEALDRFPRLGDWLRTINLRPELIEAVPLSLSLDALLQMPASQVLEMMRRLGSTTEESARLSGALSCLKSATESGGELREDGVPWLSEPIRRDSGSLLTVEQLNSMGGALPRPHSPSPLARPSTTPSTPCGALWPHPRSGSVSAAPGPEPPSPYCYGDSPLTDPFPMSQARVARLHGRTASTPPVTPPSKRRHRLKPPCTPPPPSRKVLHLLPNITLTRSKSHESQLGHRIEDPPANKCVRKNKPLLNMQMNGGGSEDPPPRHAMAAARNPGAAPAPGTPTLMEEPGAVRNNMAVHRSSPQAVRRDIGLAVTHRFSTKSWLSQTCQVCQKNMMFGVKCKHCRLKCHNKCTKEAPSCRISFLPIAKIRRTESVPSDINKPVERPSETPQFGTLPKALTKKEHPPVLNQLDSSSNPSSTTSSTPSSPAPFQQSNPPSATPPPNPSPKGHRDSRFHFPAACYFQHRQQFIFPDVSSPAGLHSELLQDAVEVEPPAEHLHSQLVEDEDEEEEGGEEDIDVDDADPEAEDEHEADEGEVEEEEEDEGEEDDEGRGGGLNGSSDGELDGDELDELPSARGGQWKGPIARKGSQTSVYLQEWDIPFEQLDLGELIGKGRWGKVHKGRWHGEVAIRLLEIDGNNQDHLKLFKKEVMNYRQTRHENVVLFMGACMAPPHLAIITSFCKGRTLYSVVRDTKNTLDINKTRQIAQEIVKGMGYLHAKGIVHKDLKSKNVFHDTNKVVITDFGLFGISGVVQEGRRENHLKLPHGWICYLAPEIVRRMSPGNNEDRLPFSTAADVYAFGTIWYELQARDWPITNQPVEATIWQVGSGEGIKKVLGEISLGKEVTEILTACWAYDLRDRPTFTQLADMLEKLPKLNRRLSHPGHFWKSADMMKCILPLLHCFTLFGVRATTRPTPALSDEATATDAGGAAAGGWVSVSRAAATAAGQPTPADDSTALPDPATSAPSTEASGDSATRRPPPSTGPPAAWDAAAGCMFDRRSGLVLLMATGCLILLCTVLLTATVLLTWKLCQRRKGLRRDSDLISNAEYWMGTAPRNRPPSQGQTGLLLMSQLGQTLQERGDGAATEEDTLGRVEPVEQVRAQSRNDPVADGVGTPPSLKEPVDRLPGAEGAPMTTRQQALII